MLFMLVAFTLTACSSDDNESENNNPQNLPKRTYRLEVQAQQGLKTRALSLDQTGKILTADWKKDDDKLGVHVYSDTGFDDEVTLNYVGYVKAKEDGNPTTFIGDVRELPYFNYMNAQGATLVFTFPNPNSDGYEFNYGTQKYKQDGTIQTLATHFDFASATAIVEQFERQQEGDGDKLYIMLQGGNKIVFQNHAAITAFSFEDEDGNELEPSYFEVNGKGLVEEFDLFEYLFDLKENKGPYICFHDDDNPPQFGNGLFFNPQNYPSTVYVAMLNKYTSQKTEYTFFVEAREKGDSEVKRYKCKVKANLQPGLFYATTLKMKEVSNFNEEI